MPFCNESNTYILVFILNNIIFNLFSEHFTFPPVIPRQHTKRQSSFPEESLHKTPLIQRQNTDPESSIVNGKYGDNDENDDQEDSGISLCNLSRGRIPDDVDIGLAENEEEILSCSPPNLAAVPSIVCGFNSHLDSQSLRSDEIGTASSSDNSGGMEILPSSDSNALNGLTLIHAFDHSSGNSSAERIGTSSESVMMDRDEIVSIASSCDNEVRLTLMGAEEGVETEQGATGLPPVLPPRTYKAPPLPPRSRNSDAPPLPPRTPERTLEKPNFPKSSVSPIAISEGNSLALLPPPLPPRTYSPISITSNSDELAVVPQPEPAPEEETKNSFDSMETFQGSSDNCLSGGSDVPPRGATGSSVEVKRDSLDCGKSLKNESPKNLLRTIQVSLKGGSSSVQEGLRNSIDGNASCDVPVVIMEAKRKKKKANSDPSNNESVSQENKSVSNNTLFAQLSSLPSIESVVSASQCQMNSSVSHSVECSPRSSPVSVITSYSDSVTDKSRQKQMHKHNSVDRNYKQSDSVHSTPIRPIIDRTSVSASPPKIVPRGRILSEEEKQQNRQHIVQQLQQWTEKQKHKSKAESGSGQDINLSGCENSSGTSQNVSEVPPNESSVPPPTLQNRNVATLDAMSYQVDGATEESPSNAVVWQLRQPQSQAQASASPQTPG